MRRLLIPVGVVAVAAGLAGCGGGEATSLDVVRTAAAATVDAETARVDVTVEGRVDASASFVGRLDGSELDGTVKIARFEVPVKIVDSVAYVRPLGDHWLGVDLTRFGERSDEADVLQGSSVLETLGEVTDVSNEGADELDGVQTTRYDAVIDLDELADELPPRLADAMREEVGDELPVTVWIDADDLVRRVTVETSAGADRLQVDVTDVGVPVAVEAPPADQVTMLG